MDLDRQAIERRDFPIARRGYEPAAVDAHLRALAGEMEELSRRRGGGEEQSLASAAGSQVQSILRAAEKAAADIEREAEQRASDARSAADSDARITREEAIAKAREHLAAVSQATAPLQQRIASIDGEAKTLLENLRGGADRLASDLAALDANTAKLYDAASGRSAATLPPEAAPPAAPATTAERAPAPAPPTPAPVAAAPAPSPAAAATAPPQEPASAGEAPAADNGDVDGARLVALNMALSGEPRDATDRYLAEHFQLSKREALIDEVYAAIEPP